MDSRTDSNPTTSDANATPQPKRRRRIWRIIRWLLLLILVLIVLVFWPTGPATIGPDTTVITGPLNDDGTPDYAGFLDAGRCEGVTDENNAAPALRWVLGGWRSTESGSYQTPDPDQLDFSQYFEWSSTRPEATHGNYPQFQTWTCRASTRPWSEDEFPVLVRALQRNERPLAMVKALSHRPRFYLPLSHPPGPSSLVDAQGGAGIAGAGCGLKVEAMLRVHQGNLPAAWGNAECLFRLARLAAQHPTLIADMEAILLQDDAEEIVQRIADSPRLTQLDAQRMRRHVEGLTTLPDPSDILDRAARFEALDFFIGFSTMRPSVVGRTAEPRVRRIWTTFFPANRDDGLRQINRWFDRAVRVARLEPCSVRKREADAFNQDLKHTVDSGWLSGPGIRRLRPTNWIAQLMLYPCKILPDVCEARTGAIASHRLTIACLALASYRVEHRRYPASLGELALGPSALDPFADDQPFRYGQDGTGARVYSVWRNMSDDGGKTYRDGALAGNYTWDDHVVRLGPATRPD